MSEPRMAFRPISELLALALSPICGKLTQAGDLCFRRVKRDATPCWQHR